MFDMRISNADLEYSNVVWFARDPFGNVIAAQSIESDVPEFVKCDEEKAMRICNELFSFSAVDRDGKNLIDEEKASAGQGLYCYSVSDPYDSIYEVTAVPQNPVKYENMPEHIKELLKDNIVDFNAGLTSRFTVRKGRVYAC